MISNGAFLFFLNGDFILPDAKKALKINPRKPEKANLIVYDTMLNRIVKLFVRNDPNQK